MVTAGAVTCRPNHRVLACRLAAPPFRCGRQLKAVRSWRSTCAERSAADRRIIEGVKQRRRGSACQRGTWPWSEMAYSRLLEVQRLRTLRGGRSGSGLPPDRQFDRADAANSQVVAAAEVAVVAHHQRIKVADGFCRDSDLPRFDVLTKGTEQARQLWLRTSQTRSPGSHCGCQ